MNLIRFALRKPISIMVLVVGLLFFGIGAVRDIKVDILPKMDLPVIYISHPFGGYTPDQMEAYFSKNYVSILLFANGVKSIESKNLQGVSLIKITYYEGTDMAQAAAEVSALTSRVQALFPRGSQPPFIVRFDASSLPIGQLVLKSKTRTANELQELANVYVRSSFTSIPGLLSPPPFGGSPRTVEINVDPSKMRVYNLTSDQIVAALSLNNQISPSGNVRIGSTNYITPNNTTIRTIKDFEKIPLFKGDVKNLTLGDVAKVVDGADIEQGFALIDGKRSVYLSIAKAADASTWDVVRNLKKNLPKIQNSLPEDVEVSYEFDQSVYVLNSVKSLITEGVIGAVLTGLMVVLFLGDRRAAFIVILTIPISIISGVFFLKLFGFTINLMTLSGLALAIGILVDESTVTIENIHQHLDMGKSKARAIYDACIEIAMPKLLILLSILAIFAPAFMMKGIPGALFLPLALAIGFSMVTSFVLSQTFVPVMANWLLKKHAKKEPVLTKEALSEQEDYNGNGKIDRFERFRLRFMAMMDGLLKRSKLAALCYLFGIIGGAVLLMNVIGSDVFPKVNSSQFQLRMRTTEGTRVEETEVIARHVLKEIEGVAGKEHVGITSTFVGMHPSQFSVSPIYLFMAGPNEALFQVSLKDLHTNMDVFKDTLRQRIHAKHPEVKLSFEPIDLTDKILSQGSPAPIEIRLTGKDKKLNAEYANKLVNRLHAISYFRDAQINQSIKYPTLNIEIDRTKAAQLGVDMNEISRSLTASTSSSRYTEKNMWLDERSGQAYNVQVQVPLNKMNSVAEIGQIPLLEHAQRPLLSDVSTIVQGTTNGQTDNLGALSSLSVTANIHETDLGKAAKDVKGIIATLGELPRGLNIELIGLSTVLDETLSSLQSGLLIAMVVVFLMLAANFQSFRVSFVILTAAPAVVLGSLLLLLATGSTLNLQSYMGIILAVGVSLANGVLLITNAEEIRKTGKSAHVAAREAASLRLRPIIMTSIAMMAGMLPMAIGHGEAGEQVAPLGRAVIGGLLFSTFAVLIVLPLIFAWIQGKTTIQSPSLDPEDSDSKFYEPTTTN